MVAEQAPEDEDPDSPEGQKRKKKREFWKKMQFMMMKIMKVKKSSQSEKPKRSTLEEKYFRRMDKFGGDSSKFRLWLFNLGVAIGSVDK
eukprot:7053694-Karenia_brevis.AAC.1